MRAVANGPSSSTGPPSGRHGELSSQDSGQERSRCQKTCARNIRVAQSSFSLSLSPAPHHSFFSYESHGSRCTSPRKGLSPSPVLGCMLVNSQMSSKFSPVHFFSTFYSNHSPTHYVEKGATPESNSSSPSIKVGMRQGLILPGVTRQNGGRAARACADRYRKKVHAR